MADAHPPFNVSLVTPEGAAFEGEAVLLIVPGAAGEIGVLARHAPLVAPKLALTALIALGLPLSAAANPPTASAAADANA